MKNSIVTLLCSLVLSTLCAQQELSPKPYKWSFGAILLNEESCFCDNEFVPNYFPGILAKYQLKHFSIRAAVEHTQKSDLYYEYPGQYFSSSGSQKETLLRLGAEKGYTFKNIVRPYLAFDFAYMMSSSNYYSEGGFTGEKHHYLSKAKGIALIPSLGLAINLSKRISIGYEVRYRLNFTVAEGDYYNLSENTHNTYKGTKSYEHRSNRVGAIYLQVNF